MSSSSVPLSEDADARIDEEIELPDDCLAPVILIRADVAGEPWIAATGFST